MQQICRFFLIVLSFLGIASISFAGTCTTGMKSSKDLFQCINQKVQLEATRKSRMMISQHPSLSYPYGHPVTGELTFQSYANFDGVQLILISTKLVHCVGNVRLLGKLERISLGGAARTKRSYKGWKIRVKTFKCL